MSNSVTIKDVAQKAGVSIATVSRAINNNYPVSKKLRKRIDDAIEELNYSPNSVARGLKTDRSGMIGFIVSDIANPFFTNIIRATEDIIRLENYNLIVCSTDNNPDKELSYLKLLQGKMVDGIVINTTGENDDFITELSHKIPFVLSNRKIENPSFIGDFVDNDNVSGASALTAHLISLGHRRIGIVNVSLKVSTGYERFHGFCNAMRSIAIDPWDEYPYRYDTNFSEQDGFDAAAYLLSLNPPPTAIVVMNNLMALGVIRYCNRYGVRIPDELSLVVFGDIANQDLFTVQPTMIQLNLETIGNKIGNLILSRINTKITIPNQEVRYASPLIQGNSTKAFTV